MSQPPALATKAALVIFGRAIGAISRVLAIVVLARLLDKEDFGLISFALITYITVSDLVQLGLSDSVFYFIEKLPRGVHRKLVWRLARLLLGAGVAAGVVLLLVAWAATVRGYPVEGLLIPLVVLALFELPTMPILNLMIAIDRTEVSALLNIVFSLLLFAALTTTAWFQLPVETIPYCLVAYGFARLAISVLVVLRTIPSGSGLEPDGLARDLLRYSLPLGLGTLFSNLNKIVDKYVVMWLLPVAVFAEYSVGSWEIPIVPLVAGSVASVMMTRLVNHHLNGEPDALLRLWSLAIKKVSIIVLPVMVLLVVIAEELVILLFTDKYSNAVIIFMIYTLVLFHRVTDYAAVLKAIDQTRRVTRWLALTLCLNLALSVPLVMALGAPGAALSTLLSVIIGWFYVLRSISSGLRVPFSEVFPFRFYFTVMGVAVVSAVPSIAIDLFWQGPPGLEVLVKITLFVAAYFWLSIRTGVCQSSDWALLGRMVRIR